jgi:hypothetical protein
LTIDPCLMGPDSVKRLPIPFSIRGTVIANYYREAAF